MKILVTAKHWQLFFLIFMLPFVVRLLALFSFVPGLDEADCDLVLTVTQLYYMIAWAAWMWSVGDFLKPFLPGHVASVLGLYKIAASAMVVFFLIVEVTVREVGLAGGAEVFGFVAGLFGSIAVVAMLWSAWFGAKMLAGAEATFFNNKPIAPFIDFMMILIFPVGVWIVQRRVNSLNDYRLPIND